jgi:hypothetical protein
MPPSNTFFEINVVGMIAIYIAASIFAVILLSFLVRFFIKLYNTVKELVPNTAAIVATHQLIMVS